MSTYVHVAISFPFTDSSLRQLLSQVERLVNMSMGMVPSPSPLGLSLRKSLSFAELIEAHLCQERESIHPTKRVKESRHGRQKKETEKFKASSWNAKLLRIGYWEVVSKPQILLCTRGSKYNS